MGDVDVTRDGGGNPLAFDLNASEAKWWPVPNRVCLKPHTTRYKRRLRIAIIIEVRRLDFRPSSAVTSSHVVRSDQEVSNPPSIC